MAFRQVPSVPWRLIGALVLCAAVANAATFCPDSTVCYGTKLVRITQKDGSTTDGIELQITTTAGGWVGFGIGSSMSDADIVVVEPAKSSPLDMMSRGQKMPDTDTQQDWTAVQSSTAGKYIVRRAVNTGDANDKEFVKGQQSYIWAYGSSGNLGYHGPMRGTVQLDVFDETGTGSTGWAYVLSHGLLMFFAWGVFSYVGIWAAMYGKQIFKAKWYPIHTGSLFVGTGIVTIVGFILIIIPLGGLYFTNIHTTLGFLIVLAMIGQIILGKVIDKLYDPSRQKVPLQDKVHWWLGRSLSVASAINIFLGLWLVGAGAALFVVFGLWLLVVLGVFIFTHYRLKRK